MLLLLQFHRQSGRRAQVKCAPAAALHSQLAAQRAAFCCCLVVVVTFHIGDSHGVVLRPYGSFVLLLATAANLLHWLFLNALQTARGASANVGAWVEAYPFSGASCIGRA